MAVGGLGAAAATSSKMITMMIAGIVITIGVIGGMIILSIIPALPANGSSEGYGEEYKCPSIMLKSIYSNVSDTFTGGSIATNPSLSSLSTMAYKSITSKKNVAGCVIQSSRAWGPYNDSTTTSRRRRRATSTAGLYSIGTMRCFYSTPCMSQADKGKYSNSTSITTCVKDRLTATNSMFTKSGALTEWSPVPNSLAYSIVNALSTSYTVVSIQKIFGVRPSNAASIASNSFGLDTATQSQLMAGCMYVGQLSQSDITGIIAAQYSESTTLPTSSSTSSG